MNDEAALRETIDDYFLGLYHSDTDRLGRAFHPNARIVGPDEGELKEMDRRQFIDFAAAQPAAADRGDAFEMEILDLHIDGDIASVRVADNYIGRRFIDHLALVRIDGRWQICSKLWHVDRML